MTGTGERSGELVLVLTRVLPAPPAAVFDAFTEPGELAQWWGPEGFAIPHVELVAEAGAPYRIEMRPPAGASFHLAGELRTVERPARLAFTFRWEPPDPDDVETLATVAFADLGAATEVRLRQGPFRTEARRALHRDGWTEGFDKLERLLARRAAARR